MMRSPSLFLILSLLTPSLLQASDSFPTLTVVEPTDLTLFHDPLIRLHAIGSDDAGPVKMRIYRINASGTPILVAIGTNEINIPFDVAPYAWQSVNFRFSATDSALQETSVYISGTVNTNAALTKVLTVPGRIKSITVDAVLFGMEGQSSSVQSNSSLIRRNRHDGSDLAIAVATNTVNPIFDYFPTPAGAIYRSDQTNNSGQVTTRLSEFDGHTIAVLDDNPVPQTLTGNGSFVIWQNQQHILTLRDLTARTNVIVSTNAIGTVLPLPNGAILVGNGDVVYQDEASRRIYRFSHGFNTAITGDSQAYFPLRADATNIVAWSIPPGGGDVSSIVLITPQGEVMLNDKIKGIPATSQFQLNEDYVAFQRSGENGNDQVWERLPDGSQVLVSPPNSNSTLVQLGSRGELLFGSGVLYFVRPGSEPIPVDPSFPNVGFVDGELSIIAGSTLFRLNPYSVQPRVSAPISVAGAWQIGVAGQVGQSYVIEQSHDFVNWSELKSAVFDDSSEKPIPISLNSPEEFFRIVYR